MAFTGNLQLDKMDRGLVRFDLVNNAALDKVDLLFPGTTADILGFGTESRYLSFRPYGTERATLKADALRLTGGLKIGTFTGTPETGLVRLNGTTLEAWDGSAWQTLGGGAVSGTGTAAKLAVWTGSSTLGPIVSPEVKRALSSASGSRTIYTVPALKKAIILQPYWDASSVAASLFIVPSGGSAGSTNRLINSQSYDTNSSLFAFKWVMSAGDFLVFDSGGTSVRFQMVILEYDAGSSLDSLKSLFQSNVPTSNASLYTVPVGKQFISAPNWNLNPQRAISVGDSAWVHNTTGGAITLTIDQHDGTSDRQLHSESIAAGNLVRVFKPFYSLGMLAGDILKIRGSATGLNFWVTGYEW